MKKKNTDDKLVLANGRFIFCDSKMVAEKFGVEHKKVVRTIERIKAKNEKIEGDKLSYSIREFAPIFIRCEDVYHGKEFTAYRMNKTAFTLVAMRFTTDAAFIWQVKFAAAFATMEKTIDHISNQNANTEWLEQRASGKLIRRVETDTVKEFVEYATLQGSQSANMYYVNISQMENKALFLIDQKYKNIRDLLDIHQLATIQIADRIVSKALKEGMEQNLDYKDIYKIAKSRIETFASIHGKSVIPNQLKQISM